ncbi:MAG: gliding motility-associated C-terminal domain-containing protein [Saprospiraceae bacterium]
MYNRLFPLTITLLGTFCAVGQTPQSIQLQGKALKGPAPLADFACQDQYAGTISFANFIGQSNDIDLDTIFFCFGDQISIVHNGDANLTGDPNPFTQAGITYGFFNCPPTISGPNLASILADPCILNNPPPINQIWVTAGGTAPGNITFSNSGTLQNTFNGGNPILIWFAPLTVDNFSNKQYENDPNGVQGPCVNLNVDEAFAAVYLNEIKFANFNGSAGASGCQGTVNISGGLPEFDGSNYDVAITLIGNPNVHGMVVGGPVSHDGTLTFKVPTPGFYSINIEDGKSCGASFLADMTSCVTVTQSVQGISGAPGDNICINITNEGGWVDIVSMQYALTWDPAVLQVTNVQNLTPLLPNFNAGSLNIINDSLYFSWFEPAGNGISLPNGTVVYQICFDVVGTDGDCTPVEFVDIDEFSTIEVVNENLAILGFNGVSGDLCVSSSALVVNIIQDSVSCSNKTDGSFTINVSGGQPPYQVTWQNSSGGPVGGPGVINISPGTYTTPSNLAAGTYFVTVADGQASPNISVEQIQILGPPVVAINLNETLPACHGQNGSISADLIVGNVLVPNPTINYTFLWSNMAQTPNIANVPAGNYSLTVTEIATGCTFVASTTLADPPQLSVNVSIDSATCSGVGDGSLQIFVSGGTPNNNGDYTIELPDAGSGIVITGTMANVNGLASDIYQLIVTDANGCSRDISIFLPAKKTLAVIATIDSINCTSACSGSIFLAGTTDGAPPALPYNFNWFGVPPPPPPSVTTPSTSQVNGLCIGTYTIRIEDADGCEIDTSFTLGNPTPISVSLVSVNDETCQPGMDGSITVAVVGGSYPYDYNWNIPASDSIVTGLSAGLYSVTVEDVHGCFDILDVPVGAPVPPSLNPVLDDVVDCSNSTDGSLTAMANPGGSAITSYDWSDGQTGPNATGLAPGEYIVTVTDANGCTDMDTALVTSPLPLVLDSLTFQSPICPGGATGQAAAFVSGGTPNYTYQWSNGTSTGSILPSVPAGTYTVTIDDANGCGPVSGSITISDPPSIVATFSNIDSVSCAFTGMTCDGTATATAQYSNGAAGQFNFTWLGSLEMDNNTTSSTAVELCAGDQLLTISDGVCNITDTVFIPAPPPIVPGQQIENVSCNGLSDGEINLMPMGGTPPYSILWSGGNAGPTLSNLPAGNYTAIITDSKGCNFTHTVLVIEPLPLVAAINQNNTSHVSCPGEADGFIGVFGSGGNLGTINPRYFWENGIAPETSSIAGPLPAGTYSVTIVDFKGCADSLTYTILEPSPIQFRIGDVNPISCFGASTFITVDSVWGGNPSTYVFKVDDNANRSIGAFQPVFAGEHSIEVVDEVNGCVADTTIVIDEPGELIVELPQVVEIELGDTLSRLNPTIISGGAPIDTFIWSPADFLSCTDCKNPIVSTSEDQLYVLTVIDANGCVATGEVLVNIDKNRNIYIPNVFSPNGDGLNDLFRVFTGQGVTAINFMRIYDRWGEKMFDVSNIQPSQDGTSPAWDGTFRGKAMKPAVFMYLIEVTFYDGKVLLYRGDVALMR